LFVYTDDNTVRNYKPLTLDDVAALSDPFQAPSVASAAAALQGSSEVSYIGESTNTSVIGITAEYTTVQNLNITEGEYITEMDLDSQSSVAIFGTGVAEELFDRSEGVVGEIVRIEGQPFRVIGILEEKGGSDFGSTDDQVLIPLTTAQVRIFPRKFRGQVDTIYVSAISSDAVQSAIDEVTQVLRTQHNIDFGEDDFSIMSQQSLMDMMTGVTGVLTAFLGGIASISLMVGGIGIMNIMLVSVVERTKEIGLRKALGARKKDIMSQFLVESSLLSVLGGGIGILGGWAISALVGQIAASGDIAITPIIGLNSVVLATLFSAAVGIFFGLYPASRAANLEPVEALRSE